ncbi:Protein downstream neighbor of Son [Heracleum sosnowskyi]|uniref:Protein downstream neighbor of Son n=1 Tax=Heracleum sosnowskyi TaxID=360622 RepID=A0AAD8NCD7_9APIA|nr:Protein downstream neighbor of Son [Heracleum sosnowskyi]
MAKVAARAPLPSSNHHFDKAGSGSVSKVTTAVKRKTPSELRGEQLKRKNIIELVDESPGPVCSTRKSNEVCGIRKSDLSSKNTRYIDTRLDEVFPVRKNSIRLNLLSKKENIKEFTPSEHVDSIKSFRVSSDSNAESRSHVTNSSSSVAKDNNQKEAHPTTEKCSENTFRSVTELSRGSGNIPGLSVVDMDIAFKGLVKEPPINSASTVDAFGRTSDLTTKKFCSEFCISGRKIPLDVTLKTTMRVVLSSSVNRFHRSIACSTFSNTNQIKAQTSNIGDQKLPSVTNITTHMSSLKSVNSWVYPQSSLPPPVISALALAGTEGGQMDFLSKRQNAWEDSFRSLYYMLRKNVCNIFYVCTAQFVVMFTSANILKDGKVVCNAYISQSTRSLRSLLKEHDICFSMPLSHSKVEQVSTEDLAELSEIERHNLGQTRRLGSLSDEDNSPQSLLAIRGNESVHGLYDFLLNYRFIMISMTGVDVPMLYAPLPFENAALSAPEIRCKEVRRADHVSVPLEKKIPGELNQGLASGFCYSIEIKDSYLPPWIISSICNCLDSDENNYDISFSTQPTSTGLNVGLEAVSGKHNIESSFSFGVPHAIVSPLLDSAFLKGLNYCNDSYTASLSPV